MTPKQFTYLVRQMRTAQRNTNATMQGSAERRKALQISQALEARVDAELSGEAQPLALEMDGDE